MKPRTALLLLAGLISVACKDPPAQKVAPAPPPAPAMPKPVEQKGPDWKAAFSHDVKYDAEKKAILVDVKIEPGFHAYTVGETIGKPMLVTIDPESAWQPAGDVVYPKGETKDLPVGKSVIVEGSAQIVAPVEKKGDGKAVGKFRYQVCTDEACDRPRTAPFDLAIN